MNLHSLERELKRIFKKYILRFWFNWLVQFFLIHVSLFQVRSLFLSMTSTGSRHRDHKTTGNVLSNEVNTGLAQFFFGKDGSDKLTVDEFIEFKTNLQEEVMFLEVGFLLISNTRSAENSEKSWEKEKLQRVLFFWLSSVIFIGYNLLSKCF